jgi:sensor histidine kinase YesM
MTPLLWAAIVVGFFSLLFPLMNNFFINGIKLESAFFKLFYYIFCSFQLFVIYMSYYFYYEWHYKVLFEKLLKTKGVIYYGLGMAMTLLIFVPIHNFMISFFPVVNDLKLHSVGLQPDILNDFNFGIAIFVLTVSFPFILLKEWYKKSNAIKELEKQKSSAELSLLKEQINPHFFFNTLNNLYAMSLTNDKETPEVILKLSELMRYVIYKGKEERVKLIDEMNYISDYIDLQMIRLHKKVDFSFDINMEDNDWQISPLLLIIFVENAFKHGVELAENDTKLFLNVIQINNTLEFTCINSVEESEIVVDSGIGLENLKKRLDILYSENYILNTSVSDGFFKAYLKVTDEQS